MTRRGARAVVVLGMHRSGTSALAGVLARLGCALPVSPMEPAPDNPRGFHESRRIGSFNNMALRELGSTWHDWRALDLPGAGTPLGDRLRNGAARLLAEEFPGARLLVLKDPRLCRLLPVWLDALALRGGEAALLHVHREPLEVARSLRARHGVPLAYGLLLWLRHVLDAERLSRGLPRRFTGFGRLLADWRGEMSAFGEALGLAWPLSPEAAAASVAEFLSAGRRPREAEVADPALHPDLVARAQGVREVLDRWAEGGEDAGDHALLDRAGAELGAGAWAFVDAIAAADGRALRAEADLAEARGRVAAQGTRLDDELRGRAAVDAALAEAQAGLSEARARAAEAEAEAAGAAARRAEAEREAARAARALAQAQEGLAQVSRRAVALEEERARAIRELALLARLVAEAEGRAEAARAEAARAEAAGRATAEAAEGRLREVMGSTSWRMTSPLRRAVSLVRR